ncbi:MAG: rod-binding protein [Pseudomonadota bacterium]
MNPIGAIGSATSTGAAAAAKPEAPDPKLLKAAKDFESIFVRQMLKGLEKTTAAGAGTSASAGEKTYGSMIVDTLSESISKAGGLGLADVIAQSMAMSNPALRASAAAARSAASAATDSKSTPSAALTPQLPALNPLK